MMRVALLLPAVLLVAACGGTPMSEPPAQAPPVEARVTTAAVQPLPSTFDAGGIVQARTTAVLSARVLAPVVAVLVRPGDRVRSGQVLVRLDGRDLDASRAAAASARDALARGEDAARAELDAATAAKTLADATHTRIATLASRKSATAQELDEATAALSTATARVRGADMRLAQATAALAASRDQARAAEVTAGFSVLTAPFDGVVTEKLIEPGNLASPGVPLLRLEDTRAMRVEVQVDESRAAVVALGAPVDVLVEGQATPLVGRTAEIARTVTAAAHSFLLKIDLPAGAPVRSGMYARARFAGATRNGLAIPLESLVRRGQLTAVFVVDARNRARLRMVRIGAAAGPLVEVASGLDAGERVLVGAPPAVVDGTTIRAAVQSADARPTMAGAGR